MDEIRYTRDLLVNNQEFVYSGIFRTEDLFRTINQVLEERNYLKREKRSEELVTEAGRQVYLELRPYKDLTEEVRLLIKIKINLQGATETIVNGQNYQQGLVTIGFDAWYMTDFNKRWILKPWVYFLKGVINKYVYQWPLDRLARQELLSDTAAVYGAVKRLFKSYQPAPEQRFTEQQVRAEVEKEIRKKEKKN